jgi:hypothetical protein
VTAVFGEASAEVRIQSLPYSHLSIELGHLYFEDFADGSDALRKHFTTVAAWADAIETMERRRAKARISTCFLVDDYFGPTSSPTEILPDLLKVAAECGLRIDYLARESGCAEADGVPVAKLVEGRIVADPPPDTNGARPPVTESGWLSNGRRSPAGPAEAMSAVHGWAPPSENATNRHSVFIDVELWDERDRRRTWACAYLAAVWQLLRLGLLRHRGEPIAVPQPWEGPFPQEWAQLPAVIKLNPDAPPFAAYRTVSIIPTRFMPTEHAVRTILSQVALDDEVVAQLMGRSHAEGFDLSRETVDRISYIFGG